MIGVICPVLIQNMQIQVVQRFISHCSCQAYTSGKATDHCAELCWNQLLQGYLLWDGAPWLQLFFLCTSTPGSFVSLSWDISPGTSTTGTFTIHMDHRGPKSCSTWGSHCATNNVLSLQPVIHTLRCPTANYLIVANPWVALISPSPHECQPSFHMPPCYDDFTHHFMAHSSIQQDLC